MGSRSIRLPGGNPERLATRDIWSIENALTSRYINNGPILDPVERQWWKEEVEDLSLGLNTVMYDDKYNPSVMVKIPRFNCEDVLTGAGSVPHPTFIVNGVTKDAIYIAKYPCTYSGSGATLRATSLRNRDPGASITIDNALLACKQKGAGWHLMTNAEWAAAALLAKLQGTMPRGNNNYGQDHLIAAEKGIPSYYYPSIGRTYTGTGPRSWSHDGSLFGIYDLNGNVAEWVGGLRLNNGEIQILADNNAADNTKDQAAGSAEWKAILATDGSLVAPGTAGTLKYDNTVAGNSTASSNDVGGNPQINTVVANQMHVPGGQVDYGYSVCTFESLTAAGGVTVPNIAKLLGLAPIDASHGGDYLYVRNYAERVPYRGGFWSFGSIAGVFFLNLGFGRSYASSGIGFRSAFVI